MPETATVAPQEAPPLVLLNERISSLPAKDSKGTTTVPLGCTTGCPPSPVAPPLGARAGPQVRPPSVEVFIITESPALVTSSAPRTAVRSCWHHLSGRGCDCHRPSLCVAGGCGHPGSASRARIKDGCQDACLLAEPAGLLAVPGLLVAGRRGLPFGDLRPDDPLRFAGGQAAPGHLTRAQPGDGTGEVRAACCRGRRIRGDGTGVVQR